MNSKTLGSLTAAELRLTIENGHGISYLTEKYGCMEDQLVTRIKRLYKKTPKKAQKLLASLRENDRKACKKASEPVVTASDESSPKSTPSAQVAECEPQPEVYRGRAAKESQPEAAMVDAKDAEASSEKLAELEEKLSKEVRELELQHRDMEDLHRGNLNAKRAVLKRLEEIERESTDLGQEYEDLCLEGSEQEAEMKRLNALRKEKAAELARVREQIRESQRIVIFVCDDESISAPESDVVLDDSGYEKISNKLIRRPECRRLAVWQVELLARVIRVTAHMEGLKLSAEFVFENQQLEEVYRQLVAQYETAKRIAAML